MKKTFTHDDDVEVARLRRAGTPWDAVARAIGCGRSTLYSRARALGLTHGTPGRRPRAQRRDDPGRAARSGASALPAGSRPTWSLISSEPGPGP